MTRRRVIFFHDGLVFSTPEFNGDKREFEAHYSMDTCFADWDEIVKEFDNVDSIKTFEAASEKAQKYYYSSIIRGIEILRLEVTKDIPVADEVYVIENGKVHLLEAEDKEDAVSTSI